MAQYYMVANTVSSTSTGSVFLLPDRVVLPDCVVYTISAPTPREDPDGALVPLPVRKPHRYEILGYTPRHWGEHGR